MRPTCSMTRAPLRVANAERFRPKFEGSNKKSMHSMIHACSPSTLLSFSPQQAAPPLSVLVAILLPGHAMPPHVVEQVRVRVMLPVCVTQLALQADQAD